MSGTFTRVIDPIEGYSDEKIIADIKAIYPWSLEEGYTVHINGYEVKFRAYPGLDVILTFGSFSGVLKVRSVTIDIVYDGDEFKLMSGVLQEVSDICYRYYWPD